ncbi:MAG: hypothetical protein JXA71_11965 [Chitinispirillaceae bacterium]|nr:hypothetical protein [Chitinispirillaceae bacterium]
MNASIYKNAYENHPHDHYSFFDFQNVPEKISKNKINEQHLAGIDDFIPEGYVKKVEKKCNGKNGRIRIITSCLERKKTVNEKTYRDDQQRCRPEQDMFDHNTRILLKH